MNAQNSLSTDSETGNSVNFLLTTSPMAKLAIIGTLVILLLIPTSMLESLITEREQTRASAISDVSSKWGDRQLVGGMVLSVPYYARDADNKRTGQLGYAHFLPDQLLIAGRVLPEHRHRGIFDVILYNTHLTVQAQFRQPSVAGLPVADADMQWNRAYLALGIQDMKGVRDPINITVNNRTQEAESGMPMTDVFQSGVGVPLTLDNSTYRVRAVLNLNGSTELTFLPVGRETRVSLQSPWTAPSFIGDFLPDQRSVTPNGFRASWRVLQVNRTYPQQGLDNFMRPSLEETTDKKTPLPTASTNPPSSFGIRLVLPVDEYQATMRSTKYAIIFVLLTFATFFLIEILDRRRIHPIQYLLVGFAICLFYVLLLSLSEQISFSWAYLIGSLTIVSLITSYVRYVINNTRLTVLFAAMLTLLYSFFYLLLQLEDYSLLIGSLGLLVILGTGMYLTRRIDWYRAYNPVQS